MVSSVGLKRFNLLGSSSSSMAGMSSLGYVISFSRYLVLKLVISASTVGICRSVCKMVFGTYHGEGGGPRWLRCCATYRKVAGSIPAGVIGIFH